MTDFAEGGSLADGRYTLERRLGAGGMAAVWLARDERLARRVAIKALSDTLAGEEGYVRRFRREARVAAGLSHPNLVRVFDFGDDPRPYLVMEYVEGGTLAEHLREPERELDCNGLVRRLLDALDHVHEARIVHRDVKPANVLMGTDRRARLTDFGIAQPEDATQLTQTGGVMGTMRYLAPEVLEGEPATPGSDLYALGMLMRDCIEPGDGPLNALADRLTERDPAERPSSAAAALALLDDEPTVADPPTEATRRMPRMPRPALPEPRELPNGRREYQLHVGGRSVAIGLGVLAAVILLIAVATGGDGGSVPDAPPPGAPLERQLDGLDRAVEALP
jgi:eukaryotic-like serine/threonine-protein kinase